MSAVDKCQPDNQRKARKHSFSVDIFRIMELLIFVNKNFYGYISRKIYKDDIRENNVKTNKKSNRKVVGISVEI